VESEAWLGLFVVAVRKARAYSYRGNHAISFCESNSAE
jgi:hypothetical protein